MDFKKKIREIPDFPVKGISFKDITTLLKDGDAFKCAIWELAGHYKDQNIDLVLGPEARGFAIGAPLAFALGVGFVPIRKPGKLPADTISYSYELEYGKDSLEVHRDAIKDGNRVLIADDLLATGGTTHATIQLVEQLGGNVVGLAFVIELPYLNGRNKLSGYNIKTLVTY